MLKPNFNLDALNLTIGILQQRKAQYSEKAKRKSLTNL